MNQLELEFQQALDFLEKRTRFGINLGLQRIEKLLDKLGNPHQKQVKYIHIGGTNGKGSTVAYLAKILQCAGYKVGVFTSPHLHCYTERMVINGKEIGKEDVIDLIQRIKPLLLELEAEGIEPPTEFEVNTAMALLYFTEQQVDYAIMEVGMGGSIDSTNVIQSEIAVITNVAMDHMAYLGNTPVEIAQVKAGIIKSGCITITGAKDPAVLQVIQAAAQEKDSHLLIINQDFGWQNRQFDGELQHFDYWEQNGPTILLETKMLGEHQLDNAALAVAAANSLGITPAVIQVGIQEMIWPGRLEIMQKRPLIVIDGAHNHHGMLALKQALQEYWPQKHIIAVIGMLADKEREAALGELLPFIETAIITKVPNARAGNWQYISTLCQKAKIPCQEIEDVSAACQVAVVALNQQFASDQDVMLLVTGSLYMIAEARTYFLQQDE